VMTTTMTTAFERRADPDERRVSPTVFLTHARWHCLFGPDSAADRPPDLGDRVAAQILKRLRDEVLAEGASCEKEKIS